MSTTDFSYVDYKFRLLSTGILLKKRSFSLLKAPLERHKSEATRIANLSTTNSGYWLLMSARVVHAGEHLVTNSADF